MVSGGGTCRQRLRRPSEEGFLYRVYRVCMYVCMYVYIYIYIYNYIDIYNYIYRVYRVYRVHRSQKSSNQVVGCKGSATLRA